MVLAVAVVPSTPAKVTARAPRTYPPICESGSNSDPESRTSRPQTGTQSLVPGISTPHAIPITAISAMWIEQTTAKPVQPTATSGRLTACGPK